MENLLAVDFLPVKTELMARYVSFHRSLIESASSEVSFLAQVVGEDVRSTTSINLNFIQDETGLDPLTASTTQVKNNIERLKVPEGQLWRIDTINFLLQERKERKAKLEPTEKLTFIIDALCSV